MTTALIVLLATITIGNILIHRQGRKLNRELDRMEAELDRMEQGRS